MRDVGPKTAYYNSASELHVVTKNLRILALKTAFVTFLCAALSRGYATYEFEIGEIFVSWYTHQRG